MLQNGWIYEQLLENFKKEAKVNGKANQWLAYFVDIDKEEKSKGITVEVGRSTFSTETKQFTVFDAPGHKNYVPNMIMGTVFADYAGLVISAKEGEFETGFRKEGQTREHVHIALGRGESQVSAHRHAAAEQVRLGRQNRRLPWADAHRAWRR